MIDAGSRDRRITLHKRSVARSPTGAEVVTYAPHCRLWAAVRDRTGRERNASGQGDALSWDAKVTVLYSAAIDAKDRIEYRNQLHDIVALTELGRREGLELLISKAL
jgi:SPP1 family predicted phage head-tail adaptor